MVPILNGSLGRAPTVIALDVVTVKLRTVPAIDVPVGKAKDTPVIVAGVLEDPPVPLVDDETLNVWLTAGDGTGARFPALSDAVPAFIEIPRVPVSVQLIGVLGQRKVNPRSVTILFIGSGGTAVSLETVGGSPAHAAPVLTRVIWMLFRVMLSAPE